MAKRKLRRLYALRKGHQVFLYEKKIDVVLSARPRQHVPSMFGPMCYEGFEAFMGISMGNREFIEFDVDPRWLYHAV